NHAVSDVQVIVNDPVPHAGDLMPRDLRMCLSSGWRDAARGFADDLDTMGLGKPQVLVGVERRTGHTVTGRACAARGIEHVAEVQEVILRHTGSRPRPELG